MTAFVRGQVFWATFSPDLGRKPYVVVSNNQRNRQLDSALVARITTTPKPPMRSIVAVPHGECVVGSIICDDIMPMYETDQPELAGGLSPLVMRQVDAALKAALGIQG